MAPWPLFFRLSIFFLWMSPSRRVRQQPHSRKGSATIKPEEGCPSQETLPAVLGMEYLAAAGGGLPTAAATVRSANGFSSEGSPRLNLKYNINYKRSWNSFHAVTTSE